MINYLDILDRFLNTINKRLFINLLLTIVINLNKFLSINLK